MRIVAVMCIPQVESDLLGRRNAADRLARDASLRTERFRRINAAFEKQLSVRTRFEQVQIDRPAPVVGPDRMRIRGKGPGLFRESGKPQRRYVTRTVAAFDEQVDVVVAARLPTQQGIHAPPSSRTSTPMRSARRSISKASFSVTIGRRYGK